MAEPADSSSLPWLAPSAGALAAWCRAPVAATWHSTLRHDPGAVLLLLRASPHDHFPAVEALAPLEFASRLLAGPTPRHGPSPDVLRLCRALAAICRDLVARAGTGDPERAWVVGLLAPLGRLADERLRGADAVAMGRRLCRAWSLPGWLAAVVGRLDLPPAHAARLGADATLFAAVRLALEAAERHGLDHGLALAGDLDERRLGPAVEVPADAPTPGWDDPHGQPLLLDLLAVALERGRLRRAPAVARLEREAEALHRELHRQALSESARLGEAKLTALAEFAAGAGHEINNPLAVISGEAQYLLRHEEWITDDGLRPVRLSLENVIAQTKRVHSLLRDLMQFARPLAARPAWFELPALMGEVASSLSGLAAQKQARVEVVAPDRFAAFADVEQLRQALACLLRNALEAAAGGWARLTLRPGERVEVWVEDSGPGPTPEQLPHLFDPFFSGRNAGRGRGMGLPVAWRLARQQGGDVRHEARRDGGPTRFVLSLPASSAGREAA